MSPLKKEKLSKIRKELDKLDNTLIKIIKKRTNLVKRVLALKEKKNLPEKISLLRLDTDFYESTKIELEVLFPKLQPGGILIIDENDY